ncbi:MAG: hypothetical protein IKS31_01185 [Clostridia bacterium]|nr:hypothetical protein [Clostridia bacterium]
MAANKQALSAALILTADALTEEWIFKDGVRLTAEQLAVYLKKDTDIDTNDRALTRICQWIYENEKQFTADREFKYGKITRSGRRRFWAIRTLEFENMMDRFRYNVESFKTWAIANDYMDVDPGRKDKTVRINGRTARCVCIVYETEADNITPIDAFDREA